MYYELLPAGVVTLPKPVGTETLSQAIRMQCALRERLRAARARQATVEEKMEELRLVNRAKWLLIEKQGLTEDEAHRRIVSQAMARRISKKAMAESVIRDLG